MRNEQPGEQPAEWSWPAVESGRSTAVGELLGSGTPEPEPLPTRARRRGADRERLRRQRRRRTLVAVVLAVALLVAAGYVVAGVLRPLFDGRSGAAEEVTDHPGPGHGSAQVVVNPGDSGAAIGETLLDAGVVASVPAFTAAYTANPDAPSIQPGTYELMLEMRASDAVSALLDTTRRISFKVTVPEGLTAAQTFERVSAVTLIPVADLEAAATDVAGIGLPPEAGGVVEGWLFPATYSFEPGSTATSILAQMVAKTVSVLDGRGIAATDRQTVLVKASLVEREGRSAEDRAKIAQAIENRLGRDMSLDIDASLAFGLGKPGTGLTNADKETDSPYNLYRVTGLPPTPIASPSEESIAAVLAPTPGDWLFWVTVNLDTGETLFANNLADHNANVQQLRAWQSENGG